MQTCEASPLRMLPPLLGAGLVQVRVCVPCPHVTEHADHADQLPLMGAATGKNNDGISYCKMSKSKACSFDKLNNQIDGAL